MESTSPTATLALLVLPTELIAHVASFLPKEDIPNLRLTCRRCQQITQRAFADAFFSTVATDFCKPSLQRLERIAQDDLLRPHVRTVLFAGLPHVPCPHRRSYHLPGTGYYWRRIGRPSYSSPPPLDPDPAVNPMIGALQAALAAFPNLDALTVDPKVGPGREPETPTATSLCVLDAVHLALLCSTALPRLRRFCILPCEIDRLWVHALVPRAALAPAWGTHLVELAVAPAPVSLHAEAEHFSLFVGMVRQARALRKLVVVRAPAGFLEFMLARLDEDGEGARPQLEVLDMRSLRNMRADVLDRFVRAFRRSLRHLYLVSARVAAEREWKDMLAGWATELERLRSFHLRLLAVTDMPGEGMLVFDGITEWAGNDGVPDEGTVEFGTRMVSLGATRVTAFQFASARKRDGEQDAQRVLGKLAEVATVELRQEENWDQPRRWTDADRFNIGGKLEGTELVSFKSPDPETS